MWTERRFNNLGRRSHLLLHHGVVDKLWWDWPNMDREKRLTDVNGPNDQDPLIGFPEFPGGMEEEAKMWGKPSAEMKALIPNPQAGDGGNVTTLNHVLTSLGMIPDATIRDVMDICGATSATSMCDLTATLPIGYSRYHNSTLLEVHHLNV
jgi:hypothetical protein